MLNRYSIFTIKYLKSFKRKKPYFDAVVSFLNNGLKNFFVFLQVILIRSRFGQNVQESDLKYIVRLG